MTPIPASSRAWRDFELDGAHLSHGELEAVRRLVRVAPGALEPGAGRVDDATLETLGLSRREIDEFRLKLQPQPPRADFTLDLGQAKDAEWFARRMEAAVPSVDRR